MLFQYSLKYICRTPLRTMIVFFLVGMICCLLCVSICLKISCEQRMNDAYNTFEVIAVPHFYASVDRFGDIIIPGSEQQNMGRIETAAKGYDLSGIANASGVLAIDSRVEMGAFLRDAGSEYTRKSASSNSSIQDVIVFTYLGQTELSLSPKKREKMPIQVEWSAIGIEPSCFSETIFVHNNIPSFDSLMDIILSKDIKVSDELLSRINEKIRGNTGNDAAISFSPGEKYIMACEYSDFKSKAGSVTKIDGVRLYSDPYHACTEYFVYQGDWRTEYSSMLTFQPPVAEINDSFETSNEKYFFQQAIEACVLNTSSLTAIATNDVNTMLPFHQGDVYITEGRSISAHEYQSGAEVCLISEEVSDVCGLQIGDTIDLAFFEATFPVGGIVDGYSAAYDPLLFDKSIEKVENIGVPFYFYNMEKIAADEHNFPFNNLSEEKSFEIIGVYGGNVSTASPETQGVSRKNGLDWRMVILPYAALKNVNNQDPSQYNTSIRLDIHSVPSFLAEISTMALNEPIPGQYEVQIEVYDQGASVVTQNLYRLEKISEIMLWLSSIVVLAVTLAISLVYISQMRKEIAIMRSLGVRSQQVAIAVASGILLVCFIGASIGAGAGYIISDNIANEAIDIETQDDIATAFTAMIVKGQIKTISTQRGNFEVAILVAGIVWLLLFTMLTIVMKVETRRRLIKSIAIQEGA